MWPNPQFPADMIKFAEEILNEKRLFYAVWWALGHYILAFLLNVKTPMENFFEILPKVKVLLSGFLHFCNDSNNPK